MKRKSTPSYLFHKQSGRARAVWTDRTGTRQQKLLPGAFDSQESRTAFAVLQLEIESAPLRSPDAVGWAVSVNEVLLGFLDHAAAHDRRPDGSTTNEFDEYKLVGRHLRELYGHAPAAEFGPLALKALRQRFVDAGWCRGFVNQRVGRARPIFERAVVHRNSPAGYPSVGGGADRHPGRTRDA